MLVFFGVLIILASVILGLFVLIQNPKGGGLSGTFGGFSNQVMGVRQTTDVLEKGTWILAVVIGLLCLASTFFISNTDNNSIPKSVMEKNVNSLPTPAPASSAQFPTGGQQAAPPAAQPTAPANSQPQQPAPKK